MSYVPYFDILDRDLNSSLDHHFTHERLQQQKPLVHVFTKHTVHAGHGILQYTNCTDCSLGICPQALTTSVAFWYGLETFRLRQKTDGLEEVGMLCLYYRM